MNTQFMFRRVTAVACVVAMLPFVFGCGVIFGGTRQVIRTMSSPDAVSLTTAPATMDQRTPASISLQRKQEYVLTFSMPGYTSQTDQLQRSMRIGILVADVILTGLVGVVVDAATGGWWKLSPEVVNVSLTKVADMPGPETITVTLSSKPSEHGTDVRIDSTVPGVRVEAH